MTKTVDLQKRPAFNDADVQRMVRSYLECALWTGLNPAHYDDPDEPESLDAVYDLDDLAPEAEAQAWDDCDAFVEYVGQQLAGLDPEQTGHDFLLTRNHHGAGFWDRGLGELGESLTRAAHTFGEADLYPGDDGRLYFS